MLTKRWQTAVELAEPGENPHTAGKRLAALARAGEVERGTYAGVAYYRLLKRVSNPRAAARKQVKNALRSGEIVKPTVCEACGSSGHLDAHHPDYDHPLDVEFLCLACHRGRHPELSGALFKTRRIQAVRLRGL